MMTNVTNPAGTAMHWNDAYRQGDTVCSWFQPQARPSLQQIEAAGIGASCSLIDVGGGTSSLVEALLDRGHTDVTVLDISAEGLRIAQHRLGCRAAQVHWLVADLRTAPGTSGTTGPFYTSSPPSPSGSVISTRSTPLPSPAATQSSLPSPRTDRCDAPACRWPATTPRN
jgi:hypothetical protein